MEKYFNGKVAVVTGAAGVICSQVAKDLAGLGVKLALVDANEENLNKIADEIKASKGECSCYTCDVTNKKSVDKLAERVIKDFGKCDFLINGAGGGVLFIPSHLVQEVVEGAAKTHVKDDFGFEMITQNKFTTAQIDRATWTKEMLDMLVEWINTDPRGEKYRYLDWSEEYYMAENGDPNDTQTML